MLLVRIGLDALRLIDGDCPRVTPSTSRVCVSPYFGLKPTGVLTLVTRCTTASLRHDASPSPLDKAERTRPTRTGLIYQKTPRRPRFSGKETGPPRLVVN